MSDEPGSVPDAPDASDAAADAIPGEAAVLDRVEDGIAVLLVGPDEVEVELPAALLPEDARDGDWFRLLVPDPTLTAARRAGLEARMDRIRRTRRGGRFGA